MHLAADDARAAALILSGLDADFAVVGPPELRDAVARLGERYARAAGTAQTAPPTSSPMP